MGRYLVLFAREPGREARAKGFAGPEAAEVFASFAEGWWQAARSAGARLVVAAPPEDRAGWRRRLGGDFLWLPQAGATFGRRLENAARAAAALGGHAVLVGGDVAPAGFALAAAFAALERGADAVLAPAPDGGVSLIALSPLDLDLLRPLEPRRGDVFARLRADLLGRGRRLALYAPVPDVDSRRSLRSLLDSTHDRASLGAAVRRALVRRPPYRAASVLDSPLKGHRASACPRGPPAA